MATLDKKMLEDQRRQLRTRVAYIFCLHFLLTPYCAYFLHQFTSLFMQLSSGTYRGKISLELDWNYLKALFLLIIKRERGMVVWWIISEIAFFCLMFNILMRPRSTLHTIREFPVTDYISIPVPAGNGQYGNAWFATRSDEERLLNTYVLSGENPEKLKERPGIVVDMKRVGDTDEIRYLKGFSHSIILAMTGAGKTRRVLLQSICLQILAGDCILVSDVKGEIYYYTHCFAKSEGYKIITIDFVNPLKSSHYNFLQPIIDALQEGREKRDKKIEELKKKILEAEDDLETIGKYAKDIEILNNDYSWTDKAQDYTWDLVAIFAGEPKGEPLWHNGETATMAACIMAICLEAPKEYWNLYNVYNFIAYMGQSNPKTHKTPLSVYLDQLPDSHPAKMIFMQSQIAAERTRSSFYTSALGTLRLFTNPRLAEMSSQSDFALGELGTQKIAIYMIIPDEKKTYYPIASVLINQMYIAQIETARKLGGKLKVPTDYDLDEIGNFPPIPVMGNMVAAGRSRGIQVNLVIQGYQQLEANYKNDFETIKAQCGLKIFLKSDDNKTLESISKTYGNYTVESTSTSTSANTNLKTQDANISNSSNLTGRKLLQEEDIGMIRYPDALIMITSERPIMTKLPDLSEYHFNKILGLGDEEHNRQLIEKLENERIERDCKSIPLWGIWNVFKEKLEEEARRQSNESGIKNEDEDM